MNVVIIILGVCVIFLVYILYTYFMSSVTQLEKQVSLNKTKITYTSDQVKNSTSTNYAYGLWIYVNTWNQNLKYILFANATDTTIPAVVSTQLNATGLNLYLDTAKPVLYYDIGVQHSTATGGAFTSGTGFPASSTNSGSRIITSNFPIQSWAQIIISVNGNIVDIYLNGRLVLSETYNVYTPPVSKTPVQLGGNNVFDATVSRFVRWSNMAVDPQAAMASYLSGNGISSFSSYNMSVDVTKNGNALSHWSTN